MNTMQRVAVYVDAEQGHLHSSFEVTGELCRRGHTVTYLSLAATEGLIRDRGFDFIPVHDGQYPLGERSFEGLETLQGPLLLKRLVSGEALDSIVSILRPTVFITLSAFSLEALSLRYRYNIPVILLQPTWFFDNRREMNRRLVGGRLAALNGHALEFLRLISNKVLVRDFDDIADLLLALPELVLFPQEFRHSTNKCDGLVYFIGPGVDMERLEVAFNWTSVDPVKPLVYCALGSQFQLKNDVSGQLFRVIVDAFSEMQTLELILAGGREFMDHPTSRYRNIHIVEWAPQIEILQRADLMITHGGSGTVKECMACGVPMIVIPLMRDQVIGGAKVVTYQIGTQLDSKTLTVDTLQKAIRWVMEDRRMKGRVLEMREWFNRSDLTVAAEVIECAASGRSDGV